MNKIVPTKAEIALLEPFVRLSARYCLSIFMSCLAQLKYR
jgi:hypothetical protein